ncbi:MAG: hypothetical protein QW279_05520 [Candidatus Jordarchaeaceae archaeon]
MKKEEITFGFPWRRLPRYLTIGIIIVVSMLLMVRLLDLLMIWGLYSWFFKSLIRIGGINEYIAGAASVWFTVTVLLLIPIVVSNIFFRRKIKGLLIISSCISLWFIILFFLSQPRRGEYFNTITGTGRWVWFKTPQGKIQLLPLGYKFDPHYGIKTQIITPEIIIEYEKQLEKEQREMKQRRDEEIQRIEKQKKEEVKKIETLPEKVEAEQKREETSRVSKIHVIKHEYKPPIYVGNSLYQRSFRIEIISVERINGKLKFGVLIRINVNGGASAGLEAPEKTAYIVDPDGNKYFFVAQENMEGDFPPGIDIRGSITFMAPPLTVKKVNLIFQFRVGAGFPDNVIFKNLDLETLKLIE